MKYDKQTTGTIIAAKGQWWFKVNTKAIRHHSTDGSIFPYIITVQYCVDGETYTCKKWLSARPAPPPVGSGVTVLYLANNPRKATVLDV